MSAPPPPPSSLPFRWSDLSTHVSSLASVTPHSPPVYLLRDGSRRAANRTRTEAMESLYSGYLSWCGDQSLTPAECVLLQVEDNGGWCRGGVLLPSIAPYALERGVDHFILWRGAFPLTHTPFFPTCHTLLLLYATGIFSRVFFSLSLKPILHICHTLFSPYITGILF